MPLRNARRGTNGKSESALIPPSTAWRSTLSALSHDKTREKNILSSKSTHILVVDDEPDVDSMFRQHFRHDLRAGRFTTEFANSAPAALERVKGNPDPSLILSDINMPGMSGLEMLPRVKQTSRLRATTSEIDPFLGLQPRRHKRLTVSHSLPPDVVSVQPDPFRSECKTVLVKIETKAQH
jgi:CheY-like chemotaxis protein